MNYIIMLAAKTVNVPIRIMLFFNEENKRFFISEDLDDKEITQLTQRPGQCVPVFQMLNNIK